MICPNCKSENTEVIDSRQFEVYRYRRYSCLMCAYRFSTRETSPELCVSVGDRMRFLPEEDLAAFLSDTFMRGCGKGEILKLLREPVGEGNT